MAANKVGDETYRGPWSSGGVLPVTTVLRLRGNCFRFARTLQVSIPSLDSGLWTVGVCRTPYRRLFTTELAARFRFLAVDSDEQTDDAAARINTRVR